MYPDYDFTLPTKKLHFQSMQLDPGPSESDPERKIDHTASETNFQSGRKNQTHRQMTK